MNDELFGNNLNPNSAETSVPEKNISDSAETEPVFSGDVANDSFRGNINIKHKKKRFPRWAITLICIVGAIWLFVSITAIFGLVNLFSNGSISFDPGNGGFRISWAVRTVKK